MRFYRRFGDLKGWQRFGFEVAIIVIGLSITFVVQEFISSAARERQTRQAMDAVEAEMVSAYAYASERLAIEPCRREQILALAARIQNASGEWTAEVPEGLNRSSEEMVLPRVVRTPFRPWTDAAWSALLDNDAAIDLDRTRFESLSAMYRGTQMLRTKQEEALRLAGRLSHLAISGPFDAAQRREAYELLGEFAVIEGAMTIHARQVHNMIQGFRFENDLRFAGFVDGGDSALKAFIEGPVATYGDCVDTTQFQPFIDDLNATAGKRFVIAPPVTTP